MVRRPALRAFDPSGSDPLPALVSELWSELEEITERAVFDALIRRDPRLSRLTAYPDDDVWSAITDHRSGAGTTGGDDDDQGQLDILGPEWHQFTHPDAAPASDDFLITATDLPTVSKAVSNVPCSPNAFAKWSH